MNDSAFEEEKVNHPSHYNAGRIEVIDFIEDQNLFQFRKRCEIHQPSRKERP